MQSNTLKIPSPTKLARLGHFPPASQAGHLAGPVFYVYVFSLVFAVVVTCSAPPPPPSYCLLIGKEFSCYTAKRNTKRVAFVAVLAKEGMRGEHQKARSFTILIFHGSLSLFL